MLARISRGGAGEREVIRGLGSFVASALLGRAPKSVLRLEMTESHRNPVKAEAIGQPQSHEEH